MDRQHTSQDGSEPPLDRDGTTGSEYYVAEEEYYEGLEYREEDFLYDTSKDAKAKAAMDPNIDPNTIPAEKAFLPPDNEIRAVTKFCDELQIEAIRIIVMKSRPANEKAYPSCVELAKRCGFTEDELKRCLRYIRDEAPMIIHVKLDQNDRLQKMLNDTHYRNQFEVKMSNGSYSPDHSSRIGWESQLFDKVYDKATPFQRPKYGVLNIVNSPNGISAANHYGDSYFVLKNVKLRSSFADQDSGNVNSVTLCSCEYYCHVLSKFSQSEFKAMMQVALGQSAYQDSGCISQYKEVQIHGALPLNECIDRVVVNDRHRGDSNIMKLLEKFCTKNNCTYIFMGDLRKELDAVQGAMK